MVRDVFDSLRPDKYVKALEYVDLDHLHDQGYRALLIDRDKTLTGWREHEVSAPKRKWLEEAMEHFELCIVSNTIFASSVNRLGEDLGLEVVSRSGLGRKPLPGAIKAGLKVVGMPPEKVVMIGDQLFTDVLGGNLMGLHTILTDPMPGPEFFLTRILRVMERRMISALNIDYDKDVCRGGSV